MSKKRVVFITSIRWGKACLEKTIENNNAEVVAIFTTEKPEKSAGYEPLDDIAKKHNIPLFKIKHINNEIEKIRELKPDWIFALGWSQILSEDFFSIPTGGLIGGHPTMLPKNRGRAPLTWAIIKGLEKTGFTFFHLAKEVDDGDILAQEEIEIGQDDTVNDLLDKVTETAGNLLEKTLPELFSENPPHIKQNPEEATYWPKRTPEDGIIDWNKTTKELDAWVRALTKPYPGAFTFYNGEKIVIWKASSKELKGNPGEILEESDGKITVGTKDSSIQIEEYEPEINAQIHNHFKNEVLEK